MKKVKCKFCGKEYSQKGIGTHIWRTHGQGKNFNPNLGYKEKTRQAWNKGLTKQTDQRVRKNSISVKEHYEQFGSHWEGKKHREQTKQKIRQKMFGNNRGGKCKWFQFEKKSGQKIKVQGTYQLRFARVLQSIDQNWIKINANDKQHGMQWKDQNGDVHLYAPDFYSPLLDRYYQVKGRWWGDDKIKMQKIIQNNKDKMIEMVFKEDLERYQKEFKLQKIDMDCYDNYIEKTRSLRQFHDERIRKRIERQKWNIKKVLWSDIDFSKRGWSTKVSKLIGIDRQRVSDWCKRFIPQFYRQKIKGTRV